MASSCRYDDLRTLRQIRQTGVPQKELRLSRLALEGTMPGGLVWAYGLFCLPLVRAIFV